MSRTIWINIRRDDQRECNEQDHTAMLDLVESLDELAVELGVQPLAAFMDETDLAYSHESAGASEPGDSGWSNETANWFDPDIALVSVEALLEHLETHRGAIALGNWSYDDLKWELEDAASELQAAVEQKTSFHFSVIE